MARRTAPAELPPFSSRSAINRCRADVTYVSKGSRRRDLFRPEMPMGTARNQQDDGESAQLLELTFRGCKVACVAAASAGKALADSSPRFLHEVREREEELDTLDREINEGVTAAITRCHSGLEARELLACLKLIIELERVGDLLLGFANRARSLDGRLQDQDVRDLSAMSALLERMLCDASDAFRRRDAELAISVLRADMEMDRLRNLTFVRHIENPENAPRQSGFHVVFMSQALERAGDHAKNMAEEVVHLVTGRSVRHMLRAQDKPDEVRFVEFMRREIRRH
jgi:phosphate transport system protein